MAHQVTDTDLQAFCADQDARHDAELQRMNCQILLGREKHGYSIGPTYARIFRYKVDNPKDRSVICFIDMAKGHILKADGWKKPAAKNPIRGTIFAPDRGASCMGPYGTLYLK